MINHQEKKGVVVITGASSGIGRATAKYLTNEGYKVYGLARRKVDDAFESIICDVTDSEAVGKVLCKIEGEAGKIDCFINNAGMGISGAVEHIADDKAEGLYAVNLIAAVNCARAVIPYLKKTKGIIINTSSIAAVIPIPFQADYSASKAAINSFTMALRLELKPFGVRVSAVMPGDTRTGFTAARDKIEDDDGYGERLLRSVERMEKDEQHGKPPESVSKVMAKLIKQKNPPALKAVGFSYKAIAFLAKILPNRFMLWLVSKLYG